ncbi:hypothetical protein GCM10022268_07020 [Sphingomonas cynarae]|uniref:Uncharacterized protein n=1 Tax=Sphingomonas cynarae TaxID=930197 RepID=A0ABP7D5G7_9SPHN
MTTDVLVVQAAEASVPTVRLVPVGHLPLLTPGMTAITNAAITDERPNGGDGTTQGGGLVGVLDVHDERHLHADAGHEQHHRRSRRRRRYDSHWRKYGSCFQRRVRGSLCKGGIRPKFQ